MLGVFFNFFLKKQIPMGPGKQPINDIKDNQ